MTTKRSNDAEIRGSSPGSVSVVVPAHQAAKEIARCLKALFAAGFGRDEILVVDDGSRDGTGDIARDLGVRVVRNAEPRRPAEARNRGAAETRSEILVFVDADVVVHSGARARILEVFASDPGLVALFGSYDDTPDAQCPVSRYRNLLHQHVHQMSAGEAQTFRTGFGAVRREAFEAAGGFRVDWENIEDVELGLRLTTQGGRIRLLGDLQAKPLKDWTLKSMFRTDLWGRAVPWTRLIRLGRTGIGSLNLALGHRVSAAMVLLFGAALALSLAVPGVLWLALSALAVFLAANVRFFALLYRQGGGRLMVPAIAYHAVHYVAVLLGYLKVRSLERPSVPGHVAEARK